MEEKRWYAAYTMPLQEEKQRNSLEELGYECFLPMDTRIVMRHEVRKQIQVPVIRGMIFLNIDELTCRKLKNDYSVKLFFISDKSTGIPIPIRSKEMQDFMCLMEHRDYIDQIIASPLKKGQRVRIIGGPLAGLEGEFMRINGDRRVVIRLEGVVSIMMTFIHPSLLEKI